jgi:mannosyltransferase
MTTRLFDKTTLRWAAVLLVLLLATFLRFHLLDAQSFWNDEGNSARLSERSIRLIIEGTASDIHPPLYYLILRGWRELVGDSEFGLRSFSAFAGVLMVAFSFGLGKILTQRRGGAEWAEGDLTQRSKVVKAERGELLQSYKVTKLQRKRSEFFVGLVTAVFVAINPALVYYSQETRMYALLGLLAVAATWLLVVWWKRPSVSIAIAYILTAAAGLYTQYFFPTVLVAHNVAVLVWLLQRGKEESKQVSGISNQPEAKLAPNETSPVHPVTLSPLHLLLRWSGMMIVTLVLYAPWLPIFLVQFSSEPVKLPSLFPFLQNVWQWLLFGATVGEVAVGWALIVAIVLLVVGGVNGRKQAILPLLMIVTPVAFMYFTGTTGPEFFKFLTISMPTVAVLLAMALIGDWLKIWGRVVVFVLLFLLLPVSWQSLTNMYHNPTFARADYRSMVARIETEAHPNAGIILEAANQWEVFTYYFEDDSIVYPFPKGRSLPKADVIDADLSEIAAQHDRLYAIFWGEAQRDPERLVERWLDENAFKATDEWIGDVRFVTYAVPSAAASEMETAVSVPFGESIQLNGFTLVENELRPGDIVQTTLFWQTAQPVENRYKVFLHVLNEQGQLVAQRDSEPGGGMAMTIDWEPAQTVVDNHGILLPYDLPEGSYQLVLGMYELANPDVRLLVGGETAVTDTFTLGNISVRQ